jgi:DNA-binding response OmpR family regulator
MSAILVVEDERHLAQGLRFNLEAEGHSVEVAETGEAALGKIPAGTQPFDFDCAGRDAAAALTVLPSVQSLRNRNQLRRQC